MMLGRRMPQRGFSRLKVKSDTRSAFSTSNQPNEGIASLSDHEKECLRWASFGKTAKETAEILGRSPRTIEFHLKSAIAKLGAVNKIQAAFLAIERGLLS